MYLKFRNLYNHLGLIAKSRPFLNDNKKNIKNNKYLSYSKNLRLSYLNKLFISYLIIVITCVGSMALFSYRLESENIKSWAIKSNSELLNNFKNTIDNFIFDSIDKVSLIVLQNAINNNDLSFYFLNPVEGHYSGLTKVSAFLNNIRATNPLISSISIYYKNNDLLVTTDGIKYSSNDNDILPDRTYIKDLCYSDNVEYWGLKKEMLSKSSDEEKVYITFVRRISPPTSESKGGGSIAIAVDENKLYTAIKSSAPIAFGQIFIIDEEGQIVSHNEKNYLFSSIKNMSYGKNILGSTNKSDYFITKIKDIDSIVSFVSSDYNNWIYVTVQPIAELIENRASFLGRTILLITIITLLFGLFVSFISTKKIYSPLRNLSELCKNIVKARSHNISRDEYGIIGSTLDILSAKVKEQEKKLEQSIPIIKHHFIQNLLKSNYSNEEIVYEKMKFLNISFNFEYFSVIIIKLGKYPEPIDFKMSEIIKLDIMDKIELFLADYNFKSVCTEAINSVNIILNLKHKNVDIIPYIKKLNDYITNVLRLNANIGIGNIYLGLDNIYTSSKEAVLCIDYSYIYPENTIFTIDDIIQWESNTDEVLRTIYEEFSNSLKTQDKKASLENINNIIDIIRIEHICYNHSMRILTQCATFIENIITELKINPDNIMSNDIYTGFNNNENILELKKWFEIIITQIFECIDERKSEKNSDFIKYVREFISENILDPSISLNYVAEVMRISPAYLSRMFKEETGINFIEFLMNEKLNAAKKMLLSNEHIKVEEVCTAVGYSSPQYFIRKFKLKYGSTPGEYRLSYFREIENSGI
jgi:two-component system response regulator YesN